MKRIGYLLVLSLLSPAFRLGAEEIQLKDGSRITGKLIAVSGDTFQVKTAYGEIQVPRSDVVSITFPENQPKKGSGAGTEAGTPPVSESLDGVTYSNRTAKFQVTFPSGWTIAPELRASKDIVAALKSPDNTLFFFVTPEEFSGTLNTYRVLAETQYQTKFKDYEKAGESEIKLDGRSGIRLIWHGKDTDSKASLKAVVYILPYEGRMVRLTFLTLEPLFNDALPTFEKIALTYHTSKP